MSKKYLAVFAPLLAVVAFAVVPAMAQAAPEWIYCMKVARGEGQFNGHLCKAGEGTETEEWEWLTVGPKAEKLAVETKGTLSLHALGKEATCTVTDLGFVWNEGGRGHDEMTLFDNSNCTGTVCPTGTVTELTALRKGLALAEANAWPSVLEETAPPVVRDKVSEIEIDVSCSGSAVDTFGGTLTPRINAANGTAEFGAGSGELEDGATPKNKASVTGNDAIAQDGNGWAVAVS